MPTHLLSVEPGAPEEPNLLAPDASAPDADTPDAPGAPDALAGDAPPPPVPPVPPAPPLAAAVRAAEPGDGVALTIVRDDDELVVDAP